MKTINIVSLVQAYSSLDMQNYNSFLDYYGVSIRNHEANDLEKLKDLLLPHTDRIDIFNDVYVGFKIPQIGKEFDLLRLGDNFVINIELKRICSDEMAKKQLLRNKYYLEALGKPVYSWVFISEINKLYFLDLNNQFHVVDFSHLTQSLENQSVSQIEDIDKYFNPSVYLVSPFNSRKKFVNNEYFLTHQQEEIKSQVIRFGQSVTQPCFISITGSAGTGKTLLIYDIVKEAIRLKKKALIIHCGYLNEGHDYLISQYGWEIIGIKYYRRYNLASYELVVVDEAQRIRPYQLEAVVEAVRSSGKMCVLSYDKVQTLSNQEEMSDIDDKIRNIDSIRSYKLTEKIRTNIEIASFIRSVFDVKRNYPKKNKGNIELNYFSNTSDAKKYLGSLGSQGWEVLRFTPSQFDNEYHKQYSLHDSKTSHGVIGQEFDNVAIAIDEHFYYDADGKLGYGSGSHYLAVKMLFQNITRVRKKLNVVVINNRQLLNRCVEILNA